MKEKGSLLKCCPSFFFFPAATSTVHESAVTAYVTTYVNMFLSGTQVSPFDIFLARQPA